MISRELVAASSRPLVLTILAHGESYGYAILNEVRSLSDGEIEWTEGMLYPVLHRLEERGLIVARWGESETGRRRKYYLLSPSGGQALESERAEWRLVDRVLERLWAAESRVTTGSSGGLTCSI